MCVDVTHTDTQRHFYPCYSVKDLAPIGLRSMCKIQG